MSVKANQNGFIKTGIKFTSKPLSNLLSRHLDDYYSKLSLVVIVAGILFSLYLQSNIPNEVFFSGDGGLKALLAEQFSSGRLNFDLTLPAADWVINLWKNGLYPFKPPFVYELFGRRYITFPFTFPLITAPFHTISGFRGLYFVPLISTWFIWLSFYRLCQRLKLGKTITAIALSILIFASPLTLYSAMYWEHTLAVALAFHGFATLLVPRTAYLSKKEAIFSGILMGLSVWFRPEFLCLVAIVVSLLFIAKIKRLKEVDLVPNRARFFIASLLLTVIAFLGINTLIYHHPTGIHSVQILEHFSWQKRVYDAWANLKELSFDLLYYFPIIAFLIICVLLFWFSKREQLPPKMKLLFVVCLLLLFSVPLIVPVGAGGKQWGPRFLLITIPVITWLTVRQLELIVRLSKPSLRYICIGLFISFLTVGIYINTYSGTVYLTKTYQGIAPAISALRDRQDSVIAISHQFIAQALPTLLDEKIFFLAEDNQAVKKLSAALLEHGYKQFTYVCYPYRSCDVPKETLDNLKFSQSGQFFRIEFSELGKFGIYPSYQVKIINAFKTD